MSDADIASFVSITCSTAQQAKQFLEMANGDLSQAIELYYQNPNPPPQTRPAPQQRPAPQPQPQRPSQPRPTGQPHRPAPGGSNPNPQSMIDDIFHHAQQEQNFDAGDDKVEKIKVTFWKNGFQVDDGDFRSNEDPQNQEFLQAVSRGMIPRELQKSGVQLDVEIEDNREKDYVPKPKPFNPFGGKAHTFGGGPSNKAAPPPRPSPQAGGGETNFAVPGRPATKIRVQMPDQLVTLSVNTSATIGDLKEYIMQNRPDFRGKKLKLDVAFPPQALTSDSVTVEQAKLKMAQINLTIL
ncbi:hypothetical protein TRFO_06195 [Tritrichomonas foetus]|uniref:SEP domain-containing protein n=1 Tax=Tritrichomonas foetus TaxID=1144522 RepID=A0A1J4K0I7_9EUKA|nr:hypothetical protein TRFO_06195 [Tritrichomonas foetus]|eukprot:OHT04755.1 hypothetical protein TRFO_06195 [Tritrichomonas foetus]